MTSSACVVISAAGARTGRGASGSGTGLAGAGSRGIVGRVGGGASVAGTILLRAPVEEFGLCRLLATRLTPWPDLGTSCLAGCSSSSSTTMALLIGLLARFATLILLLTVLGLRRLPVALVTGDGTVGVNAVVGAGCLLVDVNWVLGRCC